MTYLELVQQLALETGTALTAEITDVSWPPATSYGQSTEHLARLANWIRRAWLDIQMDQPEWAFMIYRGTMPLVTGQWSYDIKTIVDDDLELEEAPQRYDEIVPFTAQFDRPYVWVVNGATEPGQHNFCYYQMEEQFFGQSDIRSGQTRGIPGRFTIDVNKYAVLDTAPPDDEYYLEFAYKAEPQVFSAAADEPLRLPERFHDLIVYQAMLYAAGFDETDKQFKRGQFLFRRMMNKLRMAQLPEYSMPGTAT